MTYITWEDDLVLLENPERRRLYISWESSKKTTHITFIIWESSKKTTLYYLRIQLKDDLCITWESNKKTTFIKYITWESSKKTDLYYLRIQKDDDLDYLRIQ